MKINEILNEDNFNPNKITDYNKPSSWYNKYLMDPDWVAANPVKATQLAKAFKSKNAPEFIDPDFPSHIGSSTFDPVDTRFINRAVNPKDYSDDFRINGAPLRHGKFAQYRDSNDRYSDLRHAQRQSTDTGFDNAQKQLDRNYDDYPVLGPVAKSSTLGKTLNRLKGMFNEGYKLQLERDDDMYVLHITNNETGKRTEVRGKSGYESGNYDANDELHQLLDKIGKASNISDLINGEVVGINPKHPDGASAKKATDVVFNEAFDNPYKFKVTHNDGNRWQAQALTDNNIIISFLASNVDTGWGIDFKTADADTPNNTTYDLTGKGDGQRTMTTVLAMLKKFIQDHSPKEIYFDAAKDAGNSRTNLYQKIVQRFAGGLGYTVDVQDAGNRDDFTLVRKVQENFADGKVKGKSRPGRVKRSGASCNGSVSELRAKAKKASGEKAKMYHWCANMKAGKKK